jgi:hypothetical protein
MDHRYIEEHCIISRHVMGKLSTQESAEFEEHFLDCPQCLDELETVADFRCALKEVAAEQAVEVRNPARSGFAGWFARLSTWQHPAIFVTAGFLLAVLPIAVFLTRAGSARQSSEQATAVAREWQRRYELERQSAGALEKRLQEVEKKLQSQEQSRAQELGSLARLPAVATIFTLNAARSAGLERSEPLNRFAISSSPQWIVLSMDLANGSEFRNYVATLADAEDRVLWSKSRIVPTVPDSLVVTLYSGLFHSGNYTLRLEGLTPDGRKVQVGRYLFHVTITR